MHTHTRAFNGPLSRTTQVSRYQKGKANLDFIEARDGEWQWHQLGHMQVCTSLQTDNHANTPPLKFFTGRMPFLPANQQRQSTEGKPAKHSTDDYTDSEQSAFLPSVMVIMPNTCAVSTYHNGCHVSLSVCHRSSISSSSKVRGRIKAMH